MQEASAQCTALPTAQLPAQLATSLLQASFQALILLQSTREKGGRKKKLLRALGQRWENPRGQAQLPQPHLTFVPCGPGPGPARPAGSPATPAPLARAVLCAAALWSSASLGMEVAEGQEAAGWRPTPPPALRPWLPPSMASIARSSRLSSSNLRSKFCSSILCSGNGGQLRRRGAEGNNARFWPQQWCPPSFSTICRDPQQGGTAMPGLNRFSCQLLQPLNTWMYVIENGHCDCTPVLEKNPGRGLKSDSSGIRGLPCRWLTPVQPPVPKCLIVPAPSQPGVQSYE